VTTLLESKARPYGSKKGAMLSVLLHGALIAGAVVASGTAMLPDREELEEHAVLYVAPPPPKVHVAPEPLPEVKKPPATKAPRVAPPPPRAPAPPRPAAAPTPRPVAAPAAPLIAPISVPVNLPPVDLKALPTVTDVAIPEPARAASSSGGATKSSSDGDVAARGGTKGGLGSGAPDRAYSENQVDRAVQMMRGVTPRYPDALRSVNVEGVVMMRYIVDARGRVERGSIQVLSTPHKLFADAVRTALLDMRFRPAEAGGRPVRQLVEQPFVFKLDR
jgi:protein TonB